MADDFVDVAAHEAADAPLSGHQETQDEDELPGERVEEPLSVGGPCGKRDLVDESGEVDGELFFSSSANVASGRGIFSAR